jgi:hypothetical protein
VTLFDHAQISAELAEGDKGIAAVLDAHALEESQWNEATLYWMKRIGDDTLAHRERARVPLVYSEAFCQAQDALKPLPMMDTDGYAALVAAIQEMGSPAQPLAVRGLSTADYQRLSRQFAKTMASNPIEARRFFDRLQALQPPPEEERDHGEH